MVPQAAGKVPYKELEQRTRELAAFLAVSEVLAAVPDLTDQDEALGRALDKTLEITGQELGAIMLLNEKTKMLGCRVYRGFPRQHIAAFRTKVGEGFAGKVAETGEVQMTDDMTSDPRTLRPESAIEDNLRAFISVPLRAEGKILGTLNIASRNGHKFSPGEVRLLEGIGRQIAAAVENARLYQKVRENKVRQELLQETFSIQEEERRRIARELHDETSQVLATLSTNLEVAMGMLPSGTDEVRKVLKKTQALSTNILEETHKLIYQLRPTLLDDLGLVPATRWLIDSTLNDAGINVDFKLLGRERRLATKIETVIFRVVQEIVANITRHARAKNVEVRLFFRRGTMGVRIIDDGRGFDVTEALTSKERPRGLGLLGMQERVELINGTFHIVSHPGGGGTTVEIEIPSKGENDGKN